ncbi:unnamed protein product [Vicia faba]|uniref:Crossover junction endonuclease MUS81 n=1 Tax=Vicia faba TaxID=3906 RepID=A0AAV0ZCA2_VICFA|nr:unnamed protein product [Vicia faba]
MENRTRVRCPENEELASFMWNKWKDMAAQPKGLSENMEMTLSKAHFNVCNSKTPILTIKDFSLIKGVGKMILRLMQGYFGTGSGGSEPGTGSGGTEPADLTKKGNKTKGTRRYMPQRNSVAYALLITLYRGTSNGNEFMRKQELIDAAEASGLSRAPIAPEKGKGKPGHFGSSPQEWYSGWSCMKTLVSKGLVVKSSCPAKYMLTQEGKEAACDCLKRSGMAESLDKSASVEISIHMDKQNSLDMEVNAYDLESEVTSPLNQQKKPINVPFDSLERFTNMGYSKEQVISAFEHESSSHPNKDVSSLWPAVLCHLREEQVYGSQPEPQIMTSASNVVNGPRVSVRKENRTVSSSSGGHVANLCSPDIPTFPMRACSSTDHTTQKPNKDELESKMNILSMPPLSLGERFEDAYEVVLILDDREQFATQGSRSRKIIDNIRSHFKIKIEVRRLPVGDGIWIARHKNLGSEYVLDFIVERKKIDDLRSSIRDNRYKDQKLRLVRCGLRKLIYLVEGDPNSSEAAESIKTACFTTEVLEGFDVQRTTSLGDTLRKRCQDLEKMTVSDVFATQLMQVPQVTEEIALAVLDLYPTLLSLARAYSLLDGDSCAQEQMLQRQSNNVINAAASRNIFQLVWGS